MRKLSLIFLLLALGLIVSYLAVEHKQKYNFIQITCGEGDNEVQYIATKEKDGKYLVDGEYREFKDCKAQLVKPK